MSDATNRSKEACGQRAHSGGTACLHFIFCRIPKRAIFLATVLVLKLLLRHLLHVLAEHVSRSIEGVRRDCAFQAPKSTTSTTSQPPTPTSGAAILAAMNGMELPGPLKMSAVKPRESVR